MAPRSTCGCLEQPDARQRERARMAPRLPRRRSDCGKAADCCVCSPRVRKWSRGRTGSSPVRSHSRSFALLRVRRFVRDTHWRRTRMGLITCAAPFARIRAVGRDEDGTSCETQRRNGCSRSRITMRRRRMSPDVTRSVSASAQTVPCPFVLLSSATIRCRCARRWRRWRDR